jgi:hypothetical protein
VSRSRGVFLALAIAACFALAVAVPVAIARRRAAERAEIQRAIDDAWGRTPAGELFGAVRCDEKSLMIQEPLVCPGDQLASDVGQLGPRQFVLFTLVSANVSGRSDYGVVWRDDQGELHGFGCEAKDFVEAHDLAAKRIR